MSQQRLRPNPHAVAHPEITARVAHPSQGPQRAGWFEIKARLGLLALFLGLVAPITAQQALTGKQALPNGRGFLNFKVAANRAANGGLPAPARSAVVDSNGVVSLSSLSRAGFGLLRTQAVHTPLPLPLGLDGASSNAAQARIGNGGSAGPMIGFVPRAAALPSPPLAGSFQALLDNGLVVPPDTMGAVGPRHLMVVHNSEVRIQNRAGGEISRVPLDTFWASVGFPLVFDPKAVYDPYQSRWIFAAMADPQMYTASVLIGVSATDDPTGNWYLYRVYVDPVGLNWSDFTSVGFNKDWITVTANMFDIFGYYHGENIYVFNKADLFTGGAGTFTLLQDTSGRGFTMVPAVTYDQTSDVLYLVEVDNLVTNFVGVSSRLRLSTISGPVGNEVLTLGVGYAGGTNWGSSDPFRLYGGSLPQHGSPYGIAGNDCRINNVVYRNGTLWCSHHVFLPALNPTHTAAQWWQIATNGNVLQFGRLEDPSSIVSYAYASIAVNARNDVLIGFSRFSTNEYASAGYVTRFGLDPVNTLRTEGLLKAGEAPYFKTFGDFENRWGDFSASMVDPLDDLDFWTIQEYAATPTNNGVSLWGTWWGYVVMGNLTQFESPNYTGLEGAPPGFATINVFNFGGSAGSVSFSTSDGSALAGIDYLPANGLLTFEQGQIMTNFDVIILDNAIVDGTRTVNLQLFNPSPGLTLGSLSNALLSIIDDESIPPASPAGEFNFSSYVDNTYYEVTENETDYSWACYPLYEVPRQRSALGALITVVRTNGSTGRVLVDYSVVPAGSGPGFAQPYLDYLPTNGTMIFDDFQMSTNFVVTLTNLGSIVGLTNTWLGPKIFNVQLSNPRPDPQEEAMNPGLIRPGVGPGAIVPVYIYPENNGYCFESAITISNGIIGIISWSCQNAFAFERRWYRMDEYANSDPRTPGGLHRLDVSVILPLGGPGSVEVQIPNFVNGFILAPASDYALAPEPPPFPSGDIVWPNPVITPFGPMMTMTNGEDYMPTNFVLSFGQGVCRREFTLIVTNDSEVEFNEDVIMTIWQIPNNPPVNPYAQICNATILFDDQPAGALDREWNPDNVKTTFPQFNEIPGANGGVSAVAVQADGKTVLGGEFTSVNAQRRDHIARLNLDGSLDTSFVVGNGANGPVSAVLIYPTNVPNAGKILIAGSFSSYNGTTRNGIARLLPNGQLDTTFVPGSGTADLWTGETGPVRAMAMQSDGKIVIVGAFGYYNYVLRAGIARLNTDGSRDDTFDIGVGPDGPIMTVAMTAVIPGAPEKVLIGGDFIFVGTNYFGGIARLNTDGSVDAFSDLNPAGFDPGGSADGPIRSIAVQTNGMILVAGSFFTFNYISRPSIARLFPNGLLDLSFNSGIGTDNPIYALILQPNQQALLGGLFTSYNGTRRMGLARLRLDGALDTSFMDTAYNQFAGLPRTMSFEPPSAVQCLALQPDGNLMIGGTFTNVGGNASYAKEVPNYYTVFTRADKRARANIARILNGVTPGPGNAEFAVDNYYIDENGGTAHIRLDRTDGRLGTLMAAAGTVDHTAINMVDYIGTNLLAIWPQGFFQTNISLQFGIQSPTNWAPLSVGLTYPAYLDVPIKDNTYQDGDRVVDFTFLRPDGNIFLGGDPIPLGGALGKSSANLTIADNDFPAGTLAFKIANFVTNEDVGSAIISVIRTNGTSGTVGVDYFTTTLTASPVAKPGIDYTATKGTITFGPGESNATFRVLLKATSSVDFDLNVGLVLTNATGHAKLPGGLPTSIATATLTIVDVNYPPGRLNFALSGFTTNENSGGAEITVTRTGGSQGAISTTFSATSGGTNPAIVGYDFLTTNGTLVWSAGETVPKKFTVPLSPDGRVDGTKTVLLSLISAFRGSTNSPQLFGSRSNAVLYITDDDACGSYAFSQSFYQADERAGIATVIVLRRGGIAETNDVNFSVTPIDPLDWAYQSSGTLRFLPGEISKSINITIFQDGEATGNKDLILTLSNPRGLGALANCAGLGSPSVVKLTIIDAESVNTPAGSLDTAFNPSAKTDGPVYSIALQPDGNLLLAGDFTRLNDIPRSGLGRLLSDGTFDPSFDPGPGADAIVRAMTLQPDGRVLIGGDFAQVVGTNRNHIARLSSDGSLDATFDPGAGADNPVFALTLQPNDGKILVGGAFNKYNGLSRPNLVRLNTNGTVDMTFSTGSGLDGAVYAMALQADGKVLIGGSFTRINGTNRARIARLNRNGSLDLSFDPGAGVSDIVRAILVQSDGKIVVGGSFTNIAGVARNYLGRLNASGELDTNFMSTALSSNAVGGNGSVFALALQVDDKILVGGDFTTFNNVTRKRLTRLRTDGTTDPSINFGNGANSFVATLVIQPDRNILLGGGFTTYDDQSRRYLARIYGGAMSGAGQIEYASAQYVVSEVQTNVTLTVRRVGGTEGTVTAICFTDDPVDTSLKRAVPGVDYIQIISNLVSFIEGETRQSFAVRLGADTNVLEGDRFFAAKLRDFSTNTGAGPQPYTTIQIQDKESLISFASAYYSVNKNDPGGTAVITVMRQGNIFCTNTVDFATVDGGTALPTIDYWPTNGTITFVPGQSNLTFNVPIINNSLLEGLTTVSLVLSNPTSSVVSNSVQPINVVLGLSNATLNIVDKNFSGGRITFATTNYTVNEYQPYVMLTLLRTNGDSGPVTVHYSTFDITATNGLNYSGTNNEALTFNDGETFKNIFIPIREDGVRDPDLIFGVTLFGLQAKAAVLDPATNAFVTIIDDSTKPYVKFAQTNFVVGEGDTNAVITVLRGGPPTNAISVSYQTTDGTAFAGTNYTATSGQLNWALGDDAPKTFQVPLIRNYRIGPTLFVNLVLLNPVSCFIAASNATLTITDVDLPAGSVDPAFAGNYWANSNVYAVAFDVYARLYAGGDFTYMHGLAQNHLARLTTNGVVDTAFAMGAGFDNAVYAIAPYGTNSLAVGGSFTNYDGRYLGRIALLQPDGRPVPTFTPTNGADAPVCALAWSSASSIVAFTNSSITSTTNNHTNAIQVTFNQGSVSASFTFFPPASNANLGTNAISYTNTFQIWFGPVQLYATNVVVSTNAVSGNVANLPFGPGASTNLTILVNAGPLANGTPWSYAGLVIMGGLGDKLILGGEFTHVNGQIWPHLARMNVDGTLDGTFNIGLGANSNVYAVASYSTNQLLVGGDFTVMNAFTNIHLSRLNANGSVDATFKVGPGYCPDGAVRAIAPQLDGRIVIAGDFLTVGGVPRGHVARLNQDGSVDLTFNPGVGANDSVFAAAIQADGNIVLAGSFTAFDGNTFNHIVRLMPDGSVDPTFNPGHGANDIIYAVAVGGAVQPGLPSPQPQKGASPKIVGGRPTTINQFPYQVALINNPYDPNNLYPNQFCGGSILNNRWILTAAHCMFRDQGGTKVPILPSSFAVTVGITDLTQPAGSQVFLVDQFFVHPGYQPNAANPLSGNDVALVHVIADISFTGPYAAAPIALVTPAEAAAGLTDPGTMATITGWGNTSGIGLAAYPNQLQVGSLPITATTACQPPAWITPDKIMAGYPTASITTCQGDSGGPLVVTNAAGVIKEAGVVSYGPVPCAVPNCPAVFARVSALYDWITGIAGINQSLSPLAVTGDKIALGGLFTQFNNVLRPRLAVLDNNGALSTAYDPTAAANVAVYSVAVYTNTLQPFLFGKIVAGGGFGSIVGVLENRLARLNANGTIDTNFNIGLGPDEAVNSVVLQPDGKVIVGGLFTNFNGVTRPYLARLFSSGLLDDQFNVGVGLDNGIKAMALQPDGRLLIGGMFSTVYGASRSGLARMTTNGTVDTNFITGAGANVGSVNAIALQANGMVLAGGSFSSFNSLPNSGRVTRLLTNGTVDSGFSSPLKNGSVNAVAVQGDGKVVIGGIFTVGSTNSGRTNFNVARLNSDGSVDTTFNTGLGANDFVSSIVIQSDQRILLAGGFTLFDGQFRNRILRLNSDGSTDSTINFGLGANSFISAETLQNFDGKILVGGAFNQFDTEVRLGIARLLNGTNWDSGMIQFSAPAYSFQENASFAVITVLRQGGLSNAVSVNYVTSDGTAVSSGANPDYRPASGALTFANGEAIKTIAIGLINNAVTNVPRAFSVRLFASTGGAILGSPTTATVNIVDDESAIGFSMAQYTVTEDAATARMVVRRIGGNTQRATVECFTVISGAAMGTAVPTNDFTPAFAQLVFDPGVVAQNFFVRIINNPSIDLPKTISLLLSNLTGPALMGIGAATLTIIDDQRGPGVLGFTTNTYSVVKDQGQISITVQRTNGYTGTVSTRFATGNNGTARPNLDYVPTNGVLFFADGETSKTFNVAIVDDHSGIVEGTKTVDLQLFGPTGGATIGASNATLQILDNQGYGTLAFSQPVYTVAEGPSGTVTNATINVIRSAGHSGTVGVGVETKAVTATPGTDYTSVTNFLIFLPGQTNQSFTIPILHNPDVTGTKTVQLILSNPTGGADIGQPNPAFLWIYDREIGFTLSQTDYYISETNSVATITVLRNGNTNVPASVVISASNGTAKDGIQFVAGSATLNFGPGETSKPFNVTILYSPMVTGDTYANISLSSPSAGGLLTPTQLGYLHIQDVDTAICFSSAVYTVWEGSTNAVITVTRSGLTNNSVSVNYSALPITAIDGVNFVSIPSGTLILAPGQLSTNFLVTILDDTNIGPDVTVSLALNSPANAVLCAQSTAVLVIQEKDSSVGFSPTNYTVSKAVGNAAITLVRKGLATNSLSVTFLTSNGFGTNGAIAGTDYVRTSNVVTWAANDLTPKQVFVPVINNGLIQGVRTVQLLLVNAPTNVMVNPASGTLNIVDNAGSIAFAAVNSSCIAGQSATITLVRLGGSNGVVAVDYQFAGGSAVPGVDLATTNGTVAFADGEIVKTFVISTVAHASPVGFKSAQFSLTNAVGGAVVGNPASMMLTILDNQLGVIVPAGSRLVAENPPANGLIDSNETVTVELALRNIGLTNTTDLYGILLTGNGVVMTNPPPTTQSQEYGVITAGGASVAARFTFRAVGSAGSTIIATLVLREGANGLTNGIVTFSFLLGSNTTSLATGTRIDIGDYTNASPYPSVIHVSGVQGAIQKVTVTVSNLTHTYPGDIDMLLVGPNGQQVMLMSDAGTSNNAAVNGVTLTFDDTVTNVPPYRGQIVSGTYHPTNYETLVDPFPAPPAPYAAIKPPYAMNFSAFNGADANGDWLLYIVDDTPLNIGSIANGWSLGILTTQPIVLAADLSVNLSATPNPVAINGLLTYTSAVTNHGPATATNITVINTIPWTNVPSVGISQGISELFQTNGVTEVIGHLGSLAIGGWATMTVRIPAPASNSLVVAVATVSASQSDLYLTDNFTSVTNAVEFLPRLQIGIAGGSLVVVWPATIGNYDLQSTATLNPALWTKVPQVPVGPDSGYYKVTIPLSGTSQFFRLRAQ